MRRLACGFALLLLVPACGKKGPPLAPFSDLPGPVAGATATRVGSQVVLRFTVPDANADGRRPADLDRIEVWVHPTRLPDPASWPRLATPVATLRVRPAAADDADAQGAEDAEDAENAAGPGEAITRLVRQGEATALVDEVGLALPDAEPDPDAAEPDEVGTWPFPGGGGPLLWPVPARSRVYALEPRNRRGRPGAMTFVEVSLATPPSTPGRPVATYTEDRLTLAWPTSVTPPRTPIQAPLPASLSSPEENEDEDEREDDDDEEEAEDAAEPGQQPDDDPAAEPDAPAPAAQAPAAVAVETPDPDADPDADPDGDDESADEDPGLPRFVFARSLVPFAASGGYLVYEITGADPAAADDPRALVSLTDSPLSEARFETDVAFGVERCFTVRAQEMQGSVTVESAASPRVCVTPLDRFPPRAPEGLVAVAGDGAINLLWNPNEEPDLKGYRVLRGEAPGETLQTLTPMPLREATYRDTAVQPGGRYVYAVVAVDTADNASAQSNRAEETGR